MLRLLLIERDVHMLASLLLTYGLISCVQSEILSSWKINNQLQKQIYKYKHNLLFC